MIVCGSAIDPELAAHRTAIAGKALGVDAVARAILAIRLPCHHIATIGQRAEGGAILIVCGRAINPKLPADRAAIAGVALGVDAPARTILALLAIYAMRLPRHHIAAIDQCSDGRIYLIASGITINLEQSIRCATIAGIALGEDAGETAILAIIRPYERPTLSSLILPRHCIATIGQRGNGRSAFVVCGRAIDPELRIDRTTIAGIAPGVNAQAITILHIRLPRHHIASIGQSGDGGVRLIASGCDIDPKLPTLRTAIAGVALGVDAPVAAIL